MTVEKTIKIAPPTRETPGFAKRNKAFMILKQRMQDGDPEIWDAVIAALAPYVVEHVGYASAEDALWEASESELMSAIEAFAGNSTTP